MIFTIQYKSDFMKWMKLNKTEIIVLSVLLSCITSVYYFTLNFKTIRVYPFLKTNQIEINISKESLDSNASKGSYFIDSENKIHFNYSLSSKMPEPMVAVYFHNKMDSSNLLDFTNFDNLNIYLESQKSKRIPVYITLNQKNFKTTRTDLLSLPLLQVIDYTKPKTYQLSKSKFEIPSWWLRYHNVKKEDLYPLDFTKVNYVLVYNCQILKPGISDEIIISNLYISHNNLIYTYYYVGSILIMLIGFVLWKLINRKKVVLLPYESKVETNQSDSKLVKIQSYLAQHFSDSEISIKQVQDELGISSREIGELIKNECNLSFKAYLNTLRLEEIKRLLRETDLPISDIAYQMGYNTIPHFNRVFKTECSVSPKEYRESFK